MDKYRNDIFDAFDEEDDNAQVETKNEVKNLNETSKSDKKLLKQKKKREWCEDNTTKSKSKKIK